MYFYSIPKYALDRRDFHYSIRLLLDYGTNNAILLSLLWQHIFRKEAVWRNLTWNSVS